MVLPKLGKYRLLPDSSHPILFLKMDVKLLARVPANRFSKVIGQLVNRDQSAGFIPTRSDNIRHLFLNKQVPADNLGGRAILSLDPATALDSVEWPYLWEILSPFRLGDNFINWVQVLYSMPQAWLHINGSPSSPFPLRRGTRQGCPLSPLLFTLEVEPLAILIRENPDIVGIRKGQLEDKVPLYADDALLYLRDTGGSLEKLMETITRFAEFSRFTINW